MRRIKTEWQHLQDIKLAFSQNGSGPVLLLLHGNSGSKSTFKRYQTEYFKDYLTYAIDSRGHGQSRSKDHTLTYEQQSIDVIRFCEARGIKECEVIGYSDGGNLALWLAVKKPDVFKRIVAISPNTRADGTVEAALCAIQKTTAMMRRLRRFGFPNHKHIMRFELMLTDTGITDQDLAGIKSRVMILYAEKEMVLEEHLEHIAGLIGGCELEMVPETSHLSIPYYEPAIQLMQEFLRK